MNTVSAIFSRLRSAVPWALRHLMFSAAIAGVIALVTKVWFPSPFAHISGGLSLFFLMMFVDVVCGPALTLLLLHPAKSRNAIWTDISLIAAVQFCALAYGMHALSDARPIAVVFEVDRFRVVSYADLDMSRPESIPDWVRPWGFEAPRLLGVRAARTAQEKFESVGSSLQGIEPGQRPDWWQEYSVNAPEVKQRARRLDVLLAMHPQEVQRIQLAAAQAANEPLTGETTNPRDLVWLPIVSRRTMDWVAIIDPSSARIRGYIHVDGFGV